MKILLTVLVITVSLIAIPTMAEKMPKPIDKKVESLAKKLDLNDSQKQQLKAIFEESKNERETLDKKYKMDAYKAEKKLLREKRKGKVDAILNEQQKAKLDKMRKHTGKKDSKKNK